MTASAQAPSPPRKPIFDLILFDLDGTLVDTAPEIADAVNDYLVERGCGSQPESVIRGWVGHGARQLLQTALGGDVSDEQMSAFGRHYLARCGTRSRLYPAVVESLPALRRAGIKLAVVTNKEHHLAIPVLDAHGLGDCFDLVLGGDSLPAKKPDPLPIRHCLEKFGASAARTLFVGDSQIDVNAARSAGVPIWAVPYGYNRGEPIELAQPDRMIADLAELTRLLGLSAVAAG